MSNKTFNVYYSFGNIGARGQKINSFISVLAPTKEAALGRAEVELAHLQHVEIMEVVGPLNRRTFG